MADEQILTLQDEIQNVESQGDLHHPDLLPVLTKLAEVYAKSGDVYTFDAFETMERVVGIHRKHLEFTEEGMTDFSVLEEATAEQSGGSADDNPYVQAFLGYSDALVFLGELFTNQGNNVGRATPLLVEGLTIREKSLGQHHPSCAPCLSALSDIYIDQNKFKEAEPLCLRLLEITEDTSPKDSAPIALIAGRTAEVYCKLKEDEKAAAHYEKALSIIEEIKKQDEKKELPEELLQLLQTCADFHKSHQNLSIATKVYERCLSAQQVQGKTEDKLKTLTHLHNLYTREGNSDNAVKYMQQWLEAVDAAKAPLDKEYTDVQEKLASVYKANGQSENAMAALKKAIDVYRQPNMDRESLAYATLLENLSELLIAQRAYDQVEPLLTECLTIRRKQIGELEADTIRAEHDLALIYYCSGKPDEAYTLYSMCVPKLDKIMDVGSSRFADAIGRFARLHARRGEHESAMELLRRCITIRQKCEGASELYLSDLHQLALANVAKRLFREAIPILKNCLELRTKNLPQRHPDIASTLASLGNAFHKADELDEAMNIYQQHLTLMEQSSRSEREYAHTLGSLALIYHKKSMYEEALNMYRRALEANAALGVFNPAYFELTKHVSDFHTDSLSYFKAQVSRIKKQHGADNPEYAFALGKLAFLHHLAGRLTDAETHYRKALPIIADAQTFGNKHQTYAKLCGNFADVLVKSGRMKDALPLYEHCHKVFKEQHGEEHQNTIWYANLIRTLQKMIENAPTPNSPQTPTQGTPNSKNKKKGKLSPFGKSKKDKFEGPPPHAPGAAGDYTGSGSLVAAQQQQRAAPQNPMAQANNWQPDGLQQHAPPPHAP